MPLGRSPEPSPLESSAVLEELTAREPIFHRWEHLKGRKPTQADFEALTDPGFLEIGASGRTYTRDVVLKALEDRYADPNYRDDPWEASNFQLRLLSPNTFLLTYTLIQYQPAGNRTTRRTTLWRQSPSGWQILFHQGTLVQPELKSSRSNPSRNCQACIRIKSLLSET
jgi:hypothetical protein